MTSDTSRNNAKASPGKVVIEIEEHDDTVQLSLKGLAALRNLKQTFSALGCCMPIGMACKSGDTKTAAE